ncbi:MAG: flavoprotein [Acidobacteria bacterium]|nr:flavoprotein [Acidobacteriota bacterium]
MDKKRIAWAITGAGHALEECIGMIMERKKIDLFLSRAAEEVLKMYGLYSRLQASGMSICRDEGKSAPVAARFYGGRYKLLIIAPATSNSVAKFVHGISDTLVTNLFAQAGKSRVPIIVYPTDLAPETLSFGPHREPLKVYPRPIDLENTGKLRRLAGTNVVGSREELTKCLATYL